MRGRETIRIDIGPDEADMRLDRLLRKILPGMPMSHMHRLVRTGCARVNGAKAEASTRLAVGDRLDLALTSADANALRQSRRAPPQDKDLFHAVELPVIYKDADVLAFDKLSGVSAHPGSGHPLERTALGALLAVSGARSGLGAFRPSLVGRLDRDTSGVQLAGLSAAGLRGLEDASRAGAIAKTYFALVRSHRIPQEGRIDSPLLDTRNGLARMKVVESDTPGAVRAATAFTVSGEREGAALVLVRPETGRMHQIRTHFASRGWPLAGDVRYGDQAWSASLRSRFGLKRLFLHCAEVRLLHPATGRETVIASALPRELRQVLDCIGIAPPS